MVQSYSNIRQCFLDVWRCIRGLGRLLRGVVRWFWRSPAMIADRWFFLTQGLEISTQNRPQILDVAVGTHNAPTPAIAVCTLMVSNRGDRPASLYLRRWRMVMQRRAYIGQRLRAEFGLMVDSLPEYEEIPAKRHDYLIQARFASSANRTPDVWAELRRDGTRFRIYQVGAVLRRGPQGLLTVPQAFNRIGDWIPRA